MLFCAPDTLSSPAQSKHLARATADILIAWPQKAPSKTRASPSVTKLTEVVMGLAWGYSSGSASQQSSSAYCGALDPELKFDSQYQSTMILWLFNQIRTYSQRSVLFVLLQAPGS